MQMHAWHWVTMTVIAITVFASEPEAISGSAMRLAQMAIDTLNNGLDEIWDLLNRSFVR